jgi:hypothetical protein
VPKDRYVEGKASEISNADKLVLRQSQPVSTWVLFSCGESAMHRDVFLAGRARKLV